MQLEELRDSRRRVVGLKQVIKAVQSGKAEKVVFARDAENKVVSPVMELCRDAGISMLYVDKMLDLGGACGIKVGAAVAAILKQD